MCVVAGAGGDDALLEFRRGEARHCSVGSAEFEREDGLEVFTFQIDLVVDFGRDGGGEIERGLGGDVVDRR